jgi:hypothetical protein
LVVSWQFRGLPKDLHQLETVRTAPVPRGVAPNVTKIDNAGFFHGGVGNSVRQAHRRDRRWQIVEENWRLFEKMRKRRELQMPPVSRAYFLSLDSNPCQPEQMPEII